WSMQKQSGLYKQRSEPCRISPAVLFQIGRNQAGAYTSSVSVTKSTSWRVHVLVGYRNCWPFRSAIVMGFLQETDERVGRQRLAEKMALILVAVMRSKEIQLCTIFNAYCRYLKA